MKETGRAWKFIFGHMRDTWKAILVTHLAFTAISLMLFMPLIGLVGRLLLKLSGQPMLADQDIAFFLFSPVGFFALILFSSLLITVLVFEQSAMMYIAHASMRGEKISAYNAVTQSLLKLYSIWNFAARLVIRILIVVLPLLLLAALVGWYLITDYDINYYLTERPSEFWLAAITISILLFILMLILGRKLSQWSLSLPLVLFTPTSAENSFAESTRILSGRYKQAFLILLTWGLVSLLLSMGILGAIRWSGYFLLPMVMSSLKLTILITGALFAVLSLMNIVLTAFTSGTLAYLLMNLYARLGSWTAAKSPAVSAEEPSIAPPGINPRKLAAVMLAGLMAAGIYGVWLLNSIPTNNEIIIAAHRGAAGKAPENTLASIQQAIEDQTDWVEIDVQENAEGEVVVIHDSDFMKLANNPLKIWDASAAQLQEIDIGSWFDPAYSGERVPSLEQVLELVRGKAKLVIELKYYGHDEKLEQSVIDIVEQADMVEDIAIMSLKYQGIEKIRSLRPTWPIGLLSATAIGDLSRIEANFLAVSMGMVSAGFVERAQRAGKQVFVWTINDPVSLLKMVSMDVDGIITDEPEMARRVLAERAQLSTTQRLLAHVALLLGEPKATKKYRDNSP